MKKPLFMLLFMLLFLILLPGSAWAEIMFEDDFTDLGKVDTAKTTAAVDTADGCVRLPRVSTPNAVAMNKYGDGYAFVTPTGIYVNEYDDAAGEAEINNAFSVPFITDAIGVAIRQDNVNIWAIRQDGVQYCRFNGTAMTDDPALKASGIGQVLSVDAWEGTDKAALLLNNSGQAQIKIYNAGSGNMVNELTVNTTITDPVAVSIVKGTADLRVATKDTLYYLMYDDAAGNYIEDPIKKITGYTDLISLSSDESYHAVTSKTNASLIFDNDAGGGQTVAAYSIGPVTGAYAISLLKPGSYDQALVTSSGDVQYWRYDDAQGKMVRDSSMEETGVQLAGWYIYPKEYWSKIFNTAAGYDEVKLTVLQEKPASTSITYWISSDGGLNFTQLTPNTWASITVGHDFVLKAILNTTDKSVTPKIYYVKLEATTLIVKDLKVTAIARNKPEQLLPTTVFPVEVKAYPFQVFLETEESGLNRPSTVLLEQIFTVDKGRLVKKIGQISSEKLYEVEKAIHNSLGLSW